MIRVLGDIDLAEDAVAEAFAIAAEQWPKTGIPPNPGGWITTTARNRAIDRLRRESTRGERHLAAHRLHTDSMDPDPNPELDSLDDFVDVVADDQLRLMFLCAHPALAADAQVALILRLLAGLETGEIARAFLVPETDDGTTDRPGQAQASRQSRLLPHTAARRSSRTGSPRSSPPSTSSTPKATPPRRDRA